MLSGMGLDPAVEIAERIRLAVGSAPFETNEHTIPITASLGVTQAQPLDADLRAVFSRADQALYQAKSGGRNRVAVQMA